MLYPKPKSAKSQTPTRTIHSHSKLATLGPMAKKSDPFLRDLKQVYDKENINPNAPKEQRVKSYHTKNQYQKSPKNKTSKNNKTYNHQAYYAVRPAKQPDSLHNNSNSKYNHSAQLHRTSNRLKTSNRKSTEKDQQPLSHFQEQYYCAKEERHSKKMRVTLKDIKKKKSIHESEEKFKAIQETKQSVSRQALIGSLRKSLARSQVKQMAQKLKSEGSAEKNKDEREPKCCRHPDKKASHRLLDDTTNSTFCQKCAISLITKSHKMEQLNPAKPRMSAPQEQQRLDSLKDFLFSLDRLQPILSQTNTTQNEYRKFCKQKFQQQRSKLDSYYNRLRQQLAISHQRSFLTLKMYYESICEQLQKNDQTLNCINQKIRDIKGDILPNINMIVDQTKVQEDKFREILQKYLQDFSKVQKQVQLLSTCKYSCYSYDLSQKHQLLISFRDIVSPQLSLRNAVELLPLQTRRNNHSRNQSSAEKQLQHFRLSFGKEAPDSNFKTV